MSTGFRGVAVGLAGRLVGDVAGRLVGDVNRTRPHSGRVRLAVAGGRFVRGRVWGGWRRARERGRARAEVTGWVLRGLAGGRQTWDGGGRGGQEQGRRSGGMDRMVGSRGPSGRQEEGPGGLAGSRRTDTRRLCLAAGLEQAVPVRGAVGDTRGGGHLGAMHRGCDQLSARRPAPPSGRRPSGRPPHPRRPASGARSGPA